MQNYLPVVQVPIDLEAFLEILMGGVSEIEHVYNSQVEKSVALDTYDIDRFRWPNIYDVIYFILVERLEKFMPTKEAKKIAEREVDKIAEDQEILSHSPVSSRVFLRDPSGLNAVLSTIGDDIIDSCFLRYRGTDRRLQEAKLLEKIQLCIARYNWYIMEGLINAQRSHLKLEWHRARSHKIGTEQYVH